MAASNGKPAFLLEEGAEERLAGFLPTFFHGNAIIAMWILCDH
jgi:hypothetical protein